MGINLTILKLNKKFKLIFGVFRTGCLCKGTTNKIIVFGLLKRNGKSIPLLFLILNLIL